MKSFIRSLAGACTLALALALLCAAPTWAADKTPLASYPGESNQPIKAGDTASVPALKVTGISGSTQCLQAGSAGLVSGTGFACGGSGGTDVINVVDYTADPTGSTDSYAAITSAIATGKAVFFPSGTYLLSAGLSLSTDEQTFYGFSATLKKTANFDAVTVSADRARVLGLTFDANGHTGAAIVVTGNRNLIQRNIVKGGQDGIVIYGPGTVPGADLNVVDHNEVYGVTNSSVYLHNATDSSISNNTLQSPGHSNILLEAQSFSTKIIGNLLDDANTANVGAASLVAKEADSLIASANVITNTEHGGHGIELDATPATQAGHRITGNIIAANGGKAVRVYSGSGHTSDRVGIVGNRIQGNLTGSVDIGAGSTASQIVANDLNGVAPTDAGTGTIIASNDTGNTSGAGTVTTTGSPANGNLAKFSGSTSVTSGDLSGDCTTSGALAITCTKTNAVPFGTFATQNYATPPAIGGTTPAGGAFTTGSFTGNLTTNITGSTQCVTANSSGVLSGTGSACGAGGGGGGTVTSVVCGPTTITTSGSCSGLLIGVQVITTTGACTYTPTSGANAVVIELQAAGGGGGGAANPGGTNVANGQSGAGGGYLRKRLTSNFSGASCSVGAKGTGGTAGNNAGTAGGNTTFTATGGGGTVYTATGGGAGAGGGSFGAPIAVSGVAGAGATGGDVNIPGGPSGVGYSPGTTITWSGRGGDSHMGLGAASAQSFGTTATVAGNSAAGYGAGGSGAVCTTTGAAKAGGDGSNGVIIIWEYS